MSKNYLVTKANVLIEASYRLTVGEQKLILLLASMIQPDDKEFKIYQIAIKDFMDWLEVTNKNKYKQVEKITNDLMTKVLVVHTEKSKLQISWISSAEYFTGKGIVELCFDPKLKPYLLQLKKNFTTYKLKNIVQLKSYYSIRIYELLKQYEKIKERLFTLEELRNILGIQKKQYPQYANFKQKVLTVAYNEINKKTDLMFEIQEIKKGRKVDKIKFKINSKNSSVTTNEATEQIAITIDDFAEEDSTDPYIKELREIIKEDITQNEIKAILDTANNDIEKIKNKYEIAKESKCENLVGFLISAIKKDYKIPIKECSENPSKNRFHNFEQRTSKYSKEELEDILKKKEPTFPKQASR